MKHFLFYLFLCMLPLMPVFAQQQTVTRAGLSQALANRIAKETDEIFHIHLVFEKQVNFSEWNRLQESRRTSYQERAQILLEKLTANAAETQPVWVDALQKISGVDPSSMIQHYIANAISLRCNRDAILVLSSMPGILWIGENRQLKQVDTQETVVESSVASEGKEKGLAAIGAPEMWKLGYTGYNRLAFIADTGTDPSHPAISRQFNGNFQPNKASWYSLEGNAGPYDCDRHGTHVTGTILGLDRQLNDTIGVAFNSRWVAGDILCGIGTADNIGAFEWSLNPDGDISTSDDIPDVINNSWYDPSLDTLDCYSIYVPILEAMEAAGIAVIFSAGNAGPEPGTITQPHNININELNAFTVGALNGNGVNFGIANFSSIGPSHCPGEGSIKIKPEVSAPGVQVRSCVPGNDYALLSGTSMASPHVSGAVLLLKEAFPYLGGKEIKHALYHSCRDLGDPGEDNKYGMGLINVYNAYLFLLEKGHKPVSPNNRDDVSLIQIRHAVNACDKTIKPELFIENHGTDTLTSLKIHLYAAQFDTTVQWQGKIPPSSRSYIRPEIAGLPLGANKLKVTLMDPNGNPDNRTLYNSLDLVVNITETESQESKFTFADLVCHGSSFALTSPGLEKRKPLTTHWYDAPFAGNKMKEGNVVLINNADSIQTVYAEPIYREGTGQISNTLPGAGYPDELGEGIVFDVHAQIVLDSVTVYSNQIGVRNFYLYNSKGDSITSSKKYINKPGLNYVKLNWSIPPGEGYKIVKKEGKPLLTVPAQGTFPQTSPNDIVELKGGTNGDMFNYFFDWKFTYAEPCGRIPVSWEIRDDSVKTRTDFTLSKDMLSWPEEATIMASSIDNQQGTYYWEMGDGSTYITPSVTHNYSNPGTYTITFHSTDSLSCISVKQKTVTVKLVSSTSQPEPDSSDNVFIYPNPGDQTMLIELNGIKDQALHVGIFNLQGQCLYDALVTLSTGRGELNTSSLKEGAYVIVLRSRDKQWIHRWVKM